MDMKDQACHSAVMAMLQTHAEDAKVFFCSLAWRLCGFCHMRTRLSADHISPIFPSHTFPFFWQPQQSIAYCVSYGERANLEAARKQHERDRKEFKVFHHIHLPYYRPLLRYNPKLTIARAMAVVFFCHDQFLT